MIDAVRSKKIAEIESLVDTFDKLRKEYLSEVAKLRSKYGPQFVDILSQIQNNNEFISEVTDA